MEQILHIGGLHSARGLLMWDLLLLLFFGQYFF